MYKIFIFDYNKKFAVKIESYIYVVIDQFNIYIYLTVSKKIHMSTRNIKWEVGMHDE